MTSRARTQTLVAMVAAAGIVQLPTAAIVVALPTIHAEFDASLAELQWTVTAFYIPFAAFLIAAGRLADVFGRRRMLVGGAALFAGGSAIAAAAPDAQVLIAGIALSGIGGAMLMPASMSLLTNVFTGERRGFAIGMWGAATELVSGAGVLVGGLLTGELSWRWIFIVNIVFSILIVLLALRGDARVSRPVGAAARSTSPGALLTVTGLTAITLALIQGASWGWGSPAVIALFVGGLAMFVVFGFVERRTAQPAGQLRVLQTAQLPRRDDDDLRHRLLLRGVAVLPAASTSRRSSATPRRRPALLLLPLTGLMVVGSPLGGRIAARVGPRPPIVVGLVGMLVAIYWISTLTLATDYAELWVPTAIMGFGIGLALTPMNLAAMNAVSRDHAGAASGILVTLSGLGATLGVAVTGAIFGELQTQRTVDLVGDAGVQVSRDQALELEGVLAGTPGAKHTLDSVAGSDDERRRARGPRGLRLGARHQPEDLRRAGPGRDRAGGGAASAQRAGRRAALGSRSSPSVTPRPAPRGRGAG